jgi:hypothetical protein
MSPRCPPCFITHVLPLLALCVVQVQAFTSQSFAQCFMGALQFSLTPNDGPSTSLDGPFYAGDQTLLSLRTNYDPGFQQSGELCQDGMEYQFNLLSWTDGQYYTCGM